MADIQPFKVVNYSGQYAGQLDRLITPPYDVISPAEQESFYQSHPLNIIRLVLGKQYPADNAADNRYTRAASSLRRWIDEGVLTRAASAGFTIYQMEFQLPEDGRCTIDGIVALVKVDDYGKGKVLPHEKTYKGPKQDQLNLLRACRANLTPIHGLFNDEPNAIMDEYRRFMAGPPEQQISDSQGTIHRTWTIDDPESISRIQAVLQDKSLFIADGHHRYETSLAYRNEMRALGKTDPMAPHEYVMMYLCSMSHPGLRILPAHRMLKGMKDLDAAKILKILEPYFDIEPLNFSNGNRESVMRTLIQRIGSYAAVGGKFGMVLQGEKCFRLLRIKDFGAVDHLMDAQIPSTLRGLDVTILGEIIINKGLGLAQENADGEIEYTPLVEEALSKAMTGEVQVSFILNPTRVDQMRAAAELGHKLPHKSTYFYPKLSSGMVLNVFEA